MSKTGLIPNKLLLKDKKVNPSTKGNYVASTAAKDGNTDLFNLIINEKK